MYELICNKCQHEFVLNEPYQSGNCPNCEEGYYYWDHVYDEENQEEIFDGYYWD